MNCNICQGFASDSQTCKKCYFKICQWLREIPELRRESEDFVAPGRSASGAVSAERSIGVNVNALDYSMATELLAILHGWESMIRSARRLTPPAFIRKEPSIDQEVQTACDFQLAHILWTLDQDWAADFYNEVKEQHSKGLAAAKRFVEQPRRIPCPSDNCHKFVVIDAENLLNDVTCFGCRQSWTVLRLVALAMSNPNRKFFLDVEAIALWLGITQRQVYKIIKAHDITRNGALYDLAAVVAAR